MDWRKRKKRNKIMKHYGFYVYTQYELYLRVRATVQHYKEKGWFSEEDRVMLATHTVYSTYRDRWIKKHSM